MMGVRERKIRQKLSLRREILDAARELFASQGYENVTMRKIAQRIEYSPTTIYLHFKDKSQLLYHLCEETFRELADEIERVTAAEPDPVESLKRGLRTYIDFGIRYPQHYRVTFMMPAEHNMTPEEYLRTSQGGRAFGTLVQGVTACIEAGRFGGDVMLTSHVLWAGCHGITSLLIAQPDFPWGSREEVISRVIDVMVAGLEHR
jgi:AcrR family transcriptional regulator